MDRFRIIPYDGSLKSDLFRLTELLHPNRKDLRERFDWFNLNEDSNDSRLGLFAVTNDNLIAGSLWLKECAFWIHDQKHTGYFAYDFFVKEEFRSHAAGVFLLINAIKQFCPLFVIGVTPEVIPLYERMNIEKIGSFRKYLFLLNPAKALFKKLARSENRIQNAPFPNSIDIDQNNFIRREQIPSNDGSAYSDQTLIFERDMSWLHWRFGKSPYTYHTYALKEENTPCTFTLMLKSHKSLRLLVVVDYRCPTNNPILFKNMIRAVKKVGRELNVDGVAILSSLPSINKILFKEMFFPASRTAPIFSNIRKSLKNTSQGAIDPVYLTLADSDLELNFGEPL